MEAHQTKSKLAETIARMKREVLADIREGVVSPSVRSYSELHDYVDANYYGGAFEDDAPGWSPGGEVDCDFWNSAQGTIHEWLQSADFLHEIEDPSLARQTSS